MKTRLLTILTLAITFFGCSSNSSETKEKNIISNDLKIGLTRDLIKEVDSFSLPYMDSASDTPI